MLLIIPVSSAGCVRVFSKLTVVKNELRSTAIDDRSNSLMLMAVERAIIWEADLHVFVDTYALKPRKLKLQLIKDQQVVDVLQIAIGISNLHAGFKATKLQMSHIHSQNSSRLLTILR